MRYFWRGKRVLVTGHTGFKGSWLSLWLQRLGAKVSGYSLPAPSEPSLFEVARVHEGMRSLEGDVRDLDRLRRVFEETRPEVVFHLAAQALVRPSYRDPLETFSTNVMGTVHLMEAIRQTGGVRSVVTVTSDKCYENVEKREGYREGDSLGGHDPYSASKACEEIVASSYRKSFLSTGEWQVGAATARAGNVIGGGDWGQDRLVPDLMRAVLAEETLHIRYPQAIRPWQFVLDPLSGYLTLAQHLYADADEYSEAWNFAPSGQEELTVGALVDRIAEAWGETIRVEKATGQQLHEHHLLLLDPTKAEQRLGWKSRLDATETVDWIVAWYRAFRDGVDPRTTTLQQIESFQERIES